MNSRLLFQELNHIFETNPSINEFGFLISVEEFTLRNKESITYKKDASPFIVSDNSKLGIGFSCIDQLEKFVHSLYKLLIRDIEICSLLQQAPKVGFNEMREAAEYQRITEEYLNGSKLPKITLLKLCMRIMLMINADCYYILNIR